MNDLILELTGTILDTYVTSLDVRYYLLGDIDRVLGYAEGELFFDLEWLGDELAGSYFSLSPEDKVSLGRAKRIDMEADIRVLSMKGLHILLARTNQPLGRAYRRALAEALTITPAGEGERQEVRVIDRRDGNRPTKTAIFQYALERLPEDMADVPAKAALELLVLEAKHGEPCMGVRRALGIGKVRKERGQTALEKAYTPGQITNIVNIFDKLAVAFQVKPFTAREGLAIEGVDALLTAVIRDRASVQRLGLLFRSIAGKRIAGYTIDCPDVAGRMAAQWRFSALPKELTST